MLSQHEKLFNDPTLPVADKNTVFGAVDKEFQFMLGKFQALKARADALVERNRNEIALVSHTYIVFSALRKQPR
jgi:hypothetical protein